ncbi:hypothetical protein [Thalassomonas sp. RHCl1]|uniref:hypothetical protein n=1 Tax=Thalassomonas sp. RHCl1 TaxID=2995320 RepID=UPI00248B8DA9|nr:hypothetical protein [Thalassomonas sp. RHCl1]
MNFYDALMLSLIISIFILAIALFCFSRITVKHIENEMAKAGKLPPEWDKGIGARLPAYALIILFPNINRHASLVDVESTKRYARKIDWYLALFFELSFVTLIVIMALAYFLYGPE